MAIHQQRINTNPPSLVSLLTRPREDLEAEYKRWLDLNDVEHKANIAKAAIALENHGGGYIVIGFEEAGQYLESVSKPPEIGEITQDLVNGAIQRFAEPQFHCELHFTKHPSTQVTHPIIVVPGQVSVPVMSRRTREKVIDQNQFYIRKPGPKSEPPRTASEWNALIRRCTLADKNDLLNSIRSIVNGVHEPMSATATASSALEAFVDEAKSRWESLVDSTDETIDARFPLGHYQVATRLIGAQPLSTLNDVQKKLQLSRQVKFTGWPPFIDFEHVEHKSRSRHDSVENWLGRNILSTNGMRVAECDYWQADLNGNLYTISGYIEDEEQARRKMTHGTARKLIYGDLIVSRVAERLLFAKRYAETFDNVESLAIYCRFTGIDGRSLEDYKAPWQRRSVATEADCDVYGEFRIEEVESNLADMMGVLLKKFFEKFDFFEFDTVYYSKAIDDLMSRKF